MTPEEQIKILIVDDREDNLLSIETVLDHPNYKLVSATSGKAALKILLHEHDFTLILMDVQMPDMNGFETASLIYQREKLKHIPIIFITAHDNTDESIFKGYELGAIDFIYKPINPELLRFRVGIFAEMYQKKNQLVQQERKLKEMNASLQKQIEERRLSEEKVISLNEKLLQNNTNLQATIEELDRFVHVASHDLQEPLRKIMVFSDRLLNHQKEDVSEAVKSNLEKIIRSSRRMHSMINDLLTFSRNEKDKILFEPVNLNHVIDDVISDLEIEIEKAKAIFNISKLPELDANKSQMRQLFQNLISNALKFKKENEQPVISIYRSDESTTPEISNDYFHIVVEDNGIGFDNKYAEEIFVLFKRLHNYQDVEGTGVGLSICKKIMEHHKGQIKADGAPGQGSKFTLSLPNSYDKSNDISRVKTMDLKL